MELKSKNLEFKETNISVKTKSPLQLKDSRDIALFQGKRLASSAYIGAKGATKTGTEGLVNVLSSEKEGNASGASEVQRMWNASKAPREFSSKYSKKGVGFARDRLEKAFIKNNSKNVTAKTAFSPFKLRRQLFNKKAAAKQKAAANYLLKKGYKGLEKVAGKSVAGVIGKGFKGLRMAGRAMRALLSGALTIIKMISGVFLPILLLIFVVISVVVSFLSIEDDYDLTELTGTATVIRTSINVVIEKNEKEIMAFSSSFLGNKFTYDHHNNVLKGNVKKGKLIITGKIRGQEVSLEGEKKGNVYHLTGYIGKGATSSSNGKMKASDKPSKLGTQIVKNTKKYADPFSTHHNMCLGLVCEIYSNTGISDNMYVSCASEAREKYATKKGNIPLGAAVFSSPSYRVNSQCSCGRDCGHVGIYVGNGKIFSNVRPKLYTLDMWSKVFGYGGYYMPKK